ncbi:hypothetical protein ERJ75_001518500 [Trypanosoma vivax]|uniref:Uncharacterized protein n=1 Tax=Trypanosoma vivax (strain Y486) TaxID=1055687 RepID=F9WPP8_TRYVY|nr:hypothetical protein ERJ75_001518500 [Trypanosoma vivax]CCD19525.1 hypothetical protein, conserved in T.vivax [Trypanosoma vivax Y486]|eukprot:CCD19525.1 hypothetical protein, conserved in T.vivax [Trypanosoma vivax Y486]
MKVCFAAVALLALVFPSPIYGGQPLLYTDGVHEMCQFYKGLALLRDEANVKKVFKDKCGPHCISEILVSAKSLVDSFIGSSSKWKVCDSDRVHSSGCCLSTGRKNGWHSKYPKDLWVDCFSFDTAGAGDVTQFVDSYLRHGEKLQKWVSGVQLEFGRDGNVCHYTDEDGWSWHGERGYFGLFGVEVDRYYPRFPTMKMSDTFLTSGPLHTLLCMLRCAGYASKLSIGHCDDKCVGDNVQVPEAQNVEPEGHENVANGERHREPQDDQANGSAGSADGRRGTNEEDEKHTSNATQASVASDVYRSLSSSQNLTFVGSSNEIGAVKRGGDLKETAETYTPSIVSGLRGTSAATSVALLIVSFLFELFRTTALIE